MVLLARVVDDVDLAGSSPDALPREHQFTQHRLRGSGVTISLNAGAVFTWP